MHEHLQAAARERHAAALHRARDAVRSLRDRPQRITFSAVARHAGVSTDFLYATPELREIITTLRDQHHEPTATLPIGETGAMRALTAKLAQERVRHREEVAELGRALEHAHGENLELRRRLSRYE